MLVVHLVSLIHTALKHAFALDCVVDEKDPQQLTLTTSDGDKFRIFVVRE